MGYIAYQSGRFMANAELAIPVMHDPLGVVRGLRMFTTVNINGNRAVFLQAHINRLEEGAAAFGWEIKDDINSIVVNLLKQNEAVLAHQKSVMKIMVSGGNYSTNYPLVIIWLEKAPQYSHKLYEEGAKLVTFKFERQLAPVKLTFYLGMALAQPETKRQKADFPLFYGNDDIVLEGDTFNIFFIKGSQLYTPPLDGRILAGITRFHVVESALCYGLKLNEKPISRADLPTFDHAFITSSTRGVMPITQIDDCRYDRQSKLIDRIQSLYRTRFQAA